MLSLGIVGCGRVTSMFHVRAIDEVPEIRIEAVSDIDNERLVKIQQKCSVENAYESFSQLLMNEAVQAVAVNTPPRFHEEMVLDSLGHGKHVLCEKPLSMTVEGCERIKRKKEETGLIVLPARNYAFTPGLFMMEKLIADESIGPITGMRVTFENNLKVYNPVTDFRTHKVNGLIEDVLPHVLSVVHPILGYCTGVEDVTWSNKTYDVCDNMKTVLKTESGIDVQCSMSWTKLLPTFTVEVTGEEGTISGELCLNPYKVALETSEGTTVFDDRGIAWYLDLLKFKHPSFQNQYRHFFDLISNGGEPRITIDDEMNMLRTSETLSAYLEQ